MLKKEDVTFEEMVETLVKPGQDILDTLTSDRCDLWHVASCVPSEAGELFDAIKRAVIYNKVLDHENVIEELGDIEFYLERIRQILKISRRETLEANKDKLFERYAGLQYSDKAAQERADKN